MIVADGQGVAEAECAGAVPQFPAAVDLVAGQPPCLYAQVTGMGEQGGCDLGFGGEHDVVGDVGEQAPFLVGGPLGAEVQGSVDRGVPVPACVGEVDGDLAQSDAGQRSGVLAGCADTVRGGLLVPGLVHDQHRVRIGEFSGRPGSDPVPGPVVIDDRAGQEVLQPVRPAVAKGLGERPAATRVQLHQHRLGHLPDQGPWFTALETVRDLFGHRPERRRPCLLSFRGLRGHLVLKRRHKRS